ncbi:N-6 DNA methylase [Tepidimonas ignava]|uniref:site-specific DNA-methyltransferase (adenine-specific) n=1 Tax=Tepidimonas ignava TaxID=114249 RepID=A0A4R3L8A8_9BURK|nr:N-6 DNA methylase [Tepidimonas ignava]TCS95260.1 N-6 DNA methylase [Tepidimonas ignava]TSE19801.1 putative type I restriction enzymeP M protein [Tepidimonas ignava]
MSTRAPVLTYTAVRLEGGLLPAEELLRLTHLADPGATEQTESHYDIPKGLKLRDEIRRDFHIALGLWQSFEQARQRHDAHAWTLTVQTWLLPLLRHVLHFADVTPADRSDDPAPTHVAHGGHVPLVLAAHTEGLDSRAERYGQLAADGRQVRQRSPFQLAQQALNARDGWLWGLVSNGLQLRILRDSASLTRPTYLEFDLEAIFSQALLADFTALWLLAHASRFAGYGGKPPASAADCPWERWRALGLATGQTVRGRLRHQVTQALRELGTGFLRHPANDALRQRLRAPDGNYGPQAYFEELLRLVYRLIFLATVEDRRDPTSGQPLLFAPGASPEARSRYLAGYSLTWLRRRSLRHQRHDPHDDLWQALTITFAALQRGEPALGLPALGGLFGADQCPVLDAARLDNAHLLRAIFHLGWTRTDTGLARINYRDMGPEELGSVYESLLELVPDVQGLTTPATARLAFVGDGDTQASTRGHARKLSGSYYTPDALVQELIKSALEPVIQQTLRDHPQQPVQALLALTICDPACGSGHFLLAAARRLADEVAQQRAAAERVGGAPTPDDYRHALRDVVSHCLYGVDKNPMAIELARTALWLEAYCPDRPLTFLDHHLRVGDALLGVLDPKVLQGGIPDEAYTALSGDEREVAAALKKQNRADRQSWQAQSAGSLFAEEELAARVLDVEAMADDTPEGLAEKRAAWQRLQEEAQTSTLARLADLYVAAFLAPKRRDTEDTVPQTSDLWRVRHGQPLPQGVEEAARQLCREHRVFHWWLAFPQVATRGGFDVMLGNPPWEQLQISEEEFFASRAPSVAALAGDKRKKAIAELERSTPWLWREFHAAKRQYDASNLFFRAGGRFPLSAFGKLNTYALFAETFLQATRPGGRAGFIVPTGIATDDSTKAYFERLAVGGYLRSLLCLENEEFVFPSVHHSFRFALLTLCGSPTAEPASLVFFARQPAQIHDARRRFTLAADEFALINPNTRTCPVFRSRADAELTKKLYRAAPVLIREAVVDAEGRVLAPEVNPWGISFSQGLFNMTNDSGLFFDAPAAPGQPPRLPLYEAKMIHQFDHRWASYEAAGAGGEPDTVDVPEARKADPAYSVRPRYWVDEREVLARIARVPRAVARAWLAFLAAQQGRGERAAQEVARAALLLALAQWVAGELFHRQAAGVGAAAGPAGWTPAQAQPHVAPTEAQLEARFPRLLAALRSEGLTTKNAPAEFPKWAQQNLEARLADDELAELAQALRAGDAALAALLDAWMDRRSPRWLMGWRDITSAHVLRTVIASVVPRVGVGHKLPLFRFGPGTEPTLAAVFFGNLDALVLDFVARQKVGGTSLTYHYLKQFPMLPPSRYTPADLAFIVPRVLELTYTAHDLKAWYDDLAAYDPRPASERGRPFAWDPERRALLRAELDAYYARLYGLTRDELRYILDPADVMGADYPSETFRVLKEGEIRAYGEYRTRRLVLEAWDRQNAATPHATGSATA